MSKKWIIKRKPIKETVHAEKISKVDDYHFRIETRLTSFYSTSFRIKSDRFGEFLFFLPDKIDMLFKYIDSRISAIEVLKKQFDESRHINNDLKLTDEQDFILDSWLLNTITIPILVCSVIEAGVNQKIFDSKGNLGRWETNRKGQFYDCYGVQRYVSLEDKLFKVIPKINKLEIAEGFCNKAKKSIKKIISIRDSLIHQKKTPEGKRDTGELIIDDLIGTDWMSCMKEIKEILEKYQILSDGECVQREYGNPKKDPDDTRRNNSNEGS